MGMNKQELIEAMAEEAKISPADAKRALEAFVASTTKALRRGERVALVGLGSFTITKRAARKGRNPNTGKSILIKAKKVVEFVSSADLIAEDTVIYFSEESDPGTSSLLSIGRFRAISKKTPLELEDWARVVHLTPRTLSDRISREQPFDALETDRILLVQQVIERGVEVFGDVEKFRRWLGQPREHLDGMKPKDKLDSLANIGSVMAELGRIEHGVF